jgi:hypothetical protein
MTEQPSSYRLQPPPKPNDSTAIADLVIEDIKQRKQLGIERYGVALQAHNGRDNLQDAYEEAQDLTLYIKAEMVQRQKQEWIPSNIL